MINIKKILLILFTLLFIVSCENTEDKQTLKQIAITLISNYADGKGTAPTIRNYEDAGIIGVNERNLDELNRFIETLAAEDIDTEEELNTVIDALGVSLASDIFAPVITINGANPLTLKLGSTYTDPVVTAIDGRDGEVTVYCEGEVDTSRVGTYIVKHSAVDEAGNLVTVERVVNVVEEIIPTSPSPNHFIHFTVEQDPFLTAIDVTVNNTSNNDSVIQHWVYPSNDPNAILTFTLSTPLAEGETYHLEIPNIFSINSSSLPFVVDQFSGQGDCYFSAPINDTITNGIMGSTDITIDITCSNNL